jgi:hypothetical protein
MMTSSGGKSASGSMADSLSSVEEDENSLDGGAINGSSRRPPADYGSMYHHHSHSPSIPKSETKPRRKSVRPSYETEELLNLLHGSDPVRLELTRLENEVRGKLFNLHKALSQTSDYATGLTHGSHGSPFQSHCHRAYLFSRSSLQEKLSVYLCPLQITQSIRESDESWTR